MQGLLNCGSHRAQGGTGEPLGSASMELVCCSFKERNGFPEFLLIFALLVLGDGVIYRDVQSTEVLLSPLVSMMPHGNEHFFSHLQYYIRETEVPVVF